MSNYQKIDKKFKNVEENQLIVVLELKLKLDAVTLVLNSGPKFLCFIVPFYKYLWFWYQTEIDSEKVYAVI